MKNIKNESLELEETAHDSNVITVMNNYDPCGPERPPPMLPMPISPPLWSSDATLTLGCWVTMAARKAWTLSWLEDLGQRHFWRLMRTQETSTARTRNGNINTTVHRFLGRCLGETTMSSICPLLTSWHQSQYQRSYLVDFNTPLGCSGKDAVIRPLTGTLDFYSPLSCLPCTQSICVWAGLEPLPPGAPRRLAALGRADLSLPTLLEETTKTKSEPASI